jgi:23S rRNA pseudouridine1911/1915/1917 synthase
MTAPPKQQVPRELRGYRFDQIAARLYSDYSRARLQKWIREGQLRVDGRIGKVREILVGGEWLDLDDTAERSGDWQAQHLNLDIVYEDNAIIVVNKPAGLVVHPGAGNPDKTLLNGLLYYCPQLESVPRAGIVHRLDKDTTGLLVVARTLSAHHSLVTQLKARSVTREYEAVVLGATGSSGVIDEPVGRHPVVRTRMSVTSSSASAPGKPAVTRYQLLRDFNGFSYVKLRLETGRTHQIRVHMSHIGNPLLGDPLYGRRLIVPVETSAELRETLQNFNRQALHARYLALTHPETGETMAWQAPAPDDMKGLLTALNSGQNPV